MTTFLLLTLGICRRHYAPPRLRWFLTRSRSTKFSRFTIDLRAARTILACRPQSTESPERDSIHPLRFSRRDLFAAAVVGPAALGMLPGRPWSIRRSGSGVDIVIDGRVKWCINPADFGGRATVALERTNDGAVIALRDARFAGTDLRADFEARI